MRLLLCLLLFAQDPSLRELIEKLGADRPEERRAAYDALKQKGSSAAAELDRAAKSADAEVSFLARQLLLRLSLAKDFSAEFQERDPKALDRLAENGDEAWTQVFLGLAARTAPLRIDLERLAPRAVRGCRTHVERVAVCGYIVTLKIVSAREALQALCGAPDPSERVLGVQTLGGIRVPEAIPTVAALIADPVPLVRSTAIQAAERLSAMETIPAIAERLGDEAGGVRYQAVATLRRMVPARASGLALERFQSATPGTRVWLAESLGALATREAAETLRGLAEDPNPVVGISAASALGRFAEPEDLPLFKRLLGHSEPEMRKTALMALGGYGRNAPLDPILKLGKDPDEGVRVCVIFALARADNPSSVNFLIGAMKDDSTEVRAAAARTLGSFHAPESLQVLTDALKDKDVDVRSAALLALGEFPGTELAPVVIRMLGDIEESVRTDAIEIIRQRTWKQALPALLPLVEKATERDERKALLQCLAALGGPEAARVLILLSDDESDSSAIESLLRSDLWTVTAPLLRDPDPRIRGRAVRAARVGDLIQAIPQLIALLDDADPDIRRLSIEALDELNAARAIPALLQRFRKEEQAELRLDAARALGHLKAEAARPEFRTLLKSTDFEERFVGADALARWREPEALKEGRARLNADFGKDATRAIWLLTAAEDREAVPELLPLLRSPDPDLRRTALLAVGTLGGREHGVDIVPLLRDELDVIRRAAAEALALAGAREGIPALIRAAQDPDQNVRLSAFQALAKLHAPEALLLVLEQMEREEFLLGPERAAEIIGPTAVPTLLAWLKESPRRQTVAIDLLAELKAPELVRELPALLASEDAQTRVAAARAAGSLDARNCAEPLRALLRNSKVDLHAAVVRSLGSLRVAAAAVDIAPLLKSPYPWIQAAALDALGQIGRRESIPEIRELLKGEPTPVGGNWFAGRGRGREDLRWHALRALGRLGDREGIPAMRALFDATHPALRTDAASWICRLGSPEGAPILIAEVESLESLNALRQAAIWKRLEAIPWKERGDKTAREHLERLAASAGLALDFDPALTNLGFPGPERWEPDLDDVTNLAEALGLLLDPPVSAILEKDRIRLVPKIDALEFWRDWWEREGKHESKPR